MAESIEIEVSERENTSVQIEVDGRLTDTALEAALAARVTKAELLAETGADLVGLGPGQRLSDLRTSEGASLIGTRDGDSVQAAIDAFLAMLDTEEALSAKAFAGEEPHVLAVALEDGLAVAYRNNPSVPADHYEGLARNILSTAAWPRPTQVMNKAGATVWSNHNLLSFPEDISNAAWTKAACTADANGLITSSANNPQVTQQSPSATVARDLIAGLLAAADPSTDWIYVDVVQNISLKGSVYINLATRTIGTVTGDIAASLVDDPGGWNPAANDVLIRLAFNIIANNPFTLRFGPAQADGSRATGAGKKVTVKKTQVHNGTGALQPFISGIGIPVSYASGNPAIVTEGATQGIVVPVAGLERFTFRASLDRVTGASAPSLQIRSADPATQFCTLSWSGNRLNATIRNGAVGPNTYLVYDGNLNYDATGAERLEVLLGWDNATGILAISVNGEMPRFFGGGTSVTAASYSVQQTVATPVEVRLGFNNNLALIRRFILAGRLVDRSFLNWKALRPHPNMLSALPLDWWNRQGTGTGLLRMPQIRKIGEDSAAWYAIASYKISNTYPAVSEQYGAGVVRPVRIAKKAPHAISYGDLAFVDKPAGWDADTATLSQHPPHVIPGSPHIVLVNEWNAVGGAASIRVFETVDFKAFTAKGSLSKPGYLMTMTGLSNSVVRYPDDHPQFPGRIVIPIIYWSSASAALPSVMYNDNGGAFEDWVLGPPSAATISDGLGWSGFVPEANLSLNPDGTMLMLGRAHNLNNSYAHGKYAVYEVPAGGEAAPQLVRVYDDAHATQASAIVPIPVDANPAVWPKGLHAWLHSEHHGASGLERIGGVLHFIAGGNYEKVARHQLLGRTSLSFQGLEYLGDGLFLFSAEGSAGSVANQPWTLPYVGVAKLPELPAPSGWA